jgi:lipooligosaccharide transport system permease protein
MTAAVARAGVVLGWHARAYRRTWRATITVAFLNPVFFLLSVGVLLGRVVDDANPNLGGLSYLEFVAPGLLAATAMQIGTNEASFPILAGIKWVKTYHAAVATPLRIPELLAGVLAWVTVRLALATAVFTGIAVAAGAFDSPWAALAPAGAVLCGLAFASSIAALSTSIEDPQALTGVFRFVLLPMFLFSGTFFPVERLPDWLEPVAWAIPLWHGVELCRDLATGRVAAGDTLVHVGVLLAFAAAGIAVAVRQLHRRLLS